MEGRMTFGEGMKAARKEKGLSQAELARKVGLSRAAICRYEKMRRTNISFPIAVSISQALNMNINDYYPNERSIPMCNNDNCEKKVKEAIDKEDLNFFLDGYIDNAADSVVTVPREEYEELIAESTILRVVEKLVETGKYSGDTLETIRTVLMIGNAVPKPEKEDAE